MSAAASADVLEPAPLLRAETRRSRTNVDEPAAIARLMHGRRGPERIMIDVGAHVGGSLGAFKDLGWTIHAFEPDPANREHLVKRYGEAGNVVINTEAVSSESGKIVPFYASPESTGISSLHPFQSSHAKRCDVHTITLRDYIAAKRIGQVDFLKIDTEGYDLMVLQGFPWDVMRPDVILCEFEDAKTTALGYSCRDIVRFLTERGYRVFLSEWFPVVRYGTRHSWRELRPASDSDNLDAFSWGNVLAFKSAPTADELAAAVRSTVSEAPATVPAYDLKGKRILVLGNGPSLRGVDLTALPSLDTIGMNAAYRYWDRIGWYPTFYACLDTEVLRSHADAIRRLVRERETNGIRLFLLLRTILDSAPELADVPNVMFWEDWSTGEVFDAVPMLTTGAGATAFAVAMGYKEIGLIGIDLDYVETIPEARPVEGKVLEITKTPARNPNYFFDDYQRSGDRYHVPNSVPELHVNSFAGVASMARRLGARVLNGSATSRLAHFDKVPVATLLAEAWPVAPTAAATTAAGAGSSAGGWPGAVDLWSIDPDGLRLARKRRTPLYRDKVLRRMLKKGDLKRAWSAFRKLRKFDGIRYAFTHKDVLEAILTGKVTSAWAHFTSNGQREGRFNTRGPNAPCLGTADDLMAVSFDGTAYLRDHADVRDAVLAGRIGSAAIHFRQHGAKEKRRYPYCRAEAACAGTLGDLVPRYFDGLAYVDRYPDVAAAVTSGAVASAAEHFKAFGAKEGRIATFSWTKTPRTGSQFDLLQRWSERQTNLQNAAIQATISASLAGISEAVERLVDARRSHGYSAEVSAAIASLDARVQADRAETGKTLASLREDLGSTTRELENVRNTLVDKINAAVAALAPPSAYAHNRTLSATAVADLGNHWAHVFGRAMTQNELRYLAQTATEVEKRCLGRFASPVETLLARLLTLQSLAKPHIQVLEIGTLFGIGIAILYELSRTRFETIDITVIDPFEGFYGANKPDIVTGMPVNRATFQENLDRVRVPRERVRVIQGLSEAPETVAAASDRAYDLVIIDGDHSFAGVERDFALYGPMVAPDGLVIFDDYGASAWPDIKRYVDEKVMPLDGWEFLVAGHKTAVFRKRSAASAQADAAEAAAPALAVSE